jgi:hypothetical protein
MGGNEPAMEDAMRNLRFIITAGAVLGVVLVLATGAVSAQTATDNAPAKPVSLLKIVGQPATAKPETKPDAKLVKHTARRLARKSRRHATDVAAATERPAQDATDTPATGAWPAGDAAPLAGLGGVAATPAAPTAFPAVDQSLSELVVGGRTVQLAASDTINAIDLAADRDATAPNITAPPAPAPATALAQPDDQRRDAWYEELLVTLGGALTAGVLAWLLIGAAPARMYGGAKPSRPQSRAAAPQVAPLGAANSSRLARRGRA